MKKNPVKSPIRSQFKSLLRAIDILDLVEGNAALSVTEISDLLAFPRSTTYKYLAVMRECRMVDYDQVLEKCKLGMKLFELGTAVQNRIAIDRIARPYMEELSDLLGETVGLTVVDGNYALYVEKVEPGSSSTMVLLLRKGIRFPLHAGAASKILLAYQQEERIEVS
jgi:DNA-binding IclR family transcriptional regulator